MKDKDGLRDNGKNDNRTERIITGRFDDNEMDSIYI